MSTNKTWLSLLEFFEYLEIKNIKYVVMRNFNELPENYHITEHGDIDILTNDYNGICNVSGVYKVYPESYRVHHEAKIGGSSIRFDFRYVGDGYYDKKWEEDILRKKVKTEDGIYIPCNEDYEYMLLYHVLVQKKEVAQDYVKKLDDIFGEGYWNMGLLKKFMKKNGYKFTCPHDLTVGYNWKAVTGHIPIMRSIQRVYYMSKAFVCNKYHELTSMGGYLESRNLKEAWIY